MLPDSPLGSWHQARAEDAPGSSSTVTFTGCGPAEFSSLVLQGPGWTPEDPPLLSQICLAPFSNPHPFWLRESRELLLFYY